METFQSSKTIGQSFVDLGHVALNTGVGKSIARAS